MNKKAFSNLVTVTVFMLLVVVAVYSFQNWFEEYSSEKKVQIEQNSRNVRISIDSIFETTAYVNSNVAAVQLDYFKITQYGEVLCELTPGYLGEGINEINLSTCTNLIQGSLVEIFAYTNYGSIETKLKVQ